MNKLHLSTILVFKSIVLFAQDLSHLSDSIAVEEPQKYPQFTLGGTPVLAYDTDVGLRYGAVINLFDYSNREILPDYTQHVRLRLYNSTKGTSNYSVLYDTERLIPRSLVTFEASFIEDIALDFYGFNGSETVYYPEFSDENQSGYINKYFYTHHRKLFRIRADLQRQIISREFRLFSGVTYHKYRMGDIDYERFDIPEGAHGNAAIHTTLYRKFVDWGAILPEEKDGGDILTLSSGIIYDTRQGKIHCKGGVWFESYFIFSPPGVSSSYFIKQVTTFRHYVPLYSINGLLAYRLSSQQKIAGRIPYYQLPVFYGSLENQDGPGGAFTLRGVHRNRIAANSYLLGNLEFRKNLFSFTLFNIDWQTEGILFTDIGMVTGMYEFPDQGIPDDYRRDLFRDQRKRSGPHATAGAGVYLIYNKDNIISVNYGFSLDPQLGTKGLYIGSGFLF
ncbi:MAG: hypothetical protein WD577_03940 [Bacteroidales bacterium]